MAVTNVYAQAVVAWSAGGIDWENDTVKVCLLGSSYVPNLDTHAVLADLDLANNEVTGSGYTTGGAAVTGKYTSYDADSNTLTLGCGSPFWENATITGVRYAVFYKDAGGGQTTLITCTDFQANMSVQSATATVVVADTGLVSILVV